MIRLQIGVLAAVLGTGMMGCAHSHTFSHFSIYHCDECDDFPMPAYGPGFSMMPGTYTNVGGRPSGEANPPAASGGPVELAPPGQPVPGNPPAGTTPPASTTPPAISTPPMPPDAGPVPGAAARVPTLRAMDTTTPVTANSDSSLPPLPPDMDAVVVPRANPPAGTSLR